MEVQQADLPARIKAVYNSCSKAEQKILRTILQELADYGHSTTYEQVWLADYTEIPVDKKTFLTHPYYLGSTNNNGASIYPTWMNVMLELERTGNQYNEIVFTGATRTGKTSTAVSDACYQLYRLMCMRDPQSFFGLKPTTNILFFFFNLTASLAKGVAFKEMMTTIADSAWFMEHGHMNRSEATPTYIPDGKIEMKYGSDSSQALGLATFCVIFDECNFAAAGIKDINKAKARMKSKYDTLVARVTGTFVRHGEVYGRLYIISSKNSDSDFMEDYVAAQKKANNPHMYVFDKPQWEVWPKSKYSSDKMFKIALGGRNLRSFVVPDDQMNDESLAELVKQGYKLMDVPEDNKTRFLADFDIALRDIAGVSIPGTLSFITQEALNGCITRSRKNPFFTDIISVGTKDSFTIEEFFHLEVVPEVQKKMPMFIHLDLSLNTDKTGISGVVISGRKDIDVDGKRISMPTFEHVFSISIEAPRGSNIAYSKITAFICWLRKNGFNIQGISRDQFQSEYMGQILEEQGFNVKKLSLDRTPEGYMTLKTIIVEQRIDMLHVQLLEDELIQLQRDSTTGHLDHPQFGSKDMSDSFAGAVWNAVQTNPGVPIPPKTVAKAITNINGPRYSNSGGFNMFPGIKKY